MNLILLLGQARSGKDTAGRWIADAAGGVTIAFADKLKAICMEMFNLSHEDVYTDEGKRRATQFDRLALGTLPFSQSTADLQQWTVREILQHIGTESFRAVDPDVWVKHTLREAARALELSPSDDFNNRVVVITDGRFKTEVAAVRAAGGEIWRIKRPGADGAIGLVGHASEAEQQSIPDSACDVVINNDSTLDVFHERVLEGVARWRDTHSHR